MRLKRIVASRRCSTSVAANALSPLQLLTPLTSTLNTFTRRPSARSATAALPSAPVTCARARSATWRSRTRPLRATPSTHETWRRCASPARGHKPLGAAPALRASARQAPCRRRRRSPALSSTPRPQLSCCCSSARGSPRAAHRGASGLPRPPCRRGPRTRRLHRPARRPHCASAMLAPGPLPAATRSSRCWSCLARGWYGLGFGGSRG